MINPSPHRRPGPVGALRLPRLGQARRPALLLALALWIPVPGLSADPPWGTMRSDRQEVGSAPWKPRMAAPNGSLAPCKGAIPAVFAGETPAGAPAPRHTLFASICTPLDHPLAGPGIPYNLRVIDSTFLAGGSLFDPVTHARTEAEIRQQLRYLRARGVRTVIKLDQPAVPDADARTEERLCREEGLAWFPCRMTSDIVPDPSQTAAILEALRRGAYVHCRWGADRTGAVIAQYLRKIKRYTGEAAFRAVVTGGSHAGPRGGFKFKAYNRRLLLYFWPEVVTESPETCAQYGIPTDNAGGARGPGTTRPAQPSP